jgi:hypothetical protein
VRLRNPLCWALSSHVFLQSICAEVADIFLSQGNNTIRLNVYPKPNDWSG